MLAAVGLDELLALDEHAARAAAGVVDAALVGREHLDQHADDAARACRTGRPSCPRRWRTGRGSTRRRGRGCPWRGRPRLPRRDVADQVDELAEALLVEAGAGVVLGQHALERGVVALDGGHRVVDQLADGGLRGAGLAGADQRASFGTQKMLTARYSSGSSGSAPCAFCGFELGVLGLEGVGDVLEEDQAEDDVLVLGRVHVVAERVGGCPELGLQGPAVIIRLLLRGRSRLRGMVILSSG